MQLTKPAVALRLRFDEPDEPPPPSGEARCELTACAQGTAHAIVAWFTAHLDSEGEIKISTAPGEAEPMRGHSWGQLATYLPLGREVAGAGQTFTLQTRWTDKGLAFSLE